MTLKLAHVSDVHLGAKLVYLGNKADDHRNNIKIAFRNSVLEAIKNMVDVFIVSGDLFDNSFPSKALQIFVLENIKELISKDIYVVIISGNHDRSQKDGVYDSSILTEFKSDKFILFSSKKNIEGRAA